MQNYINKLEYLKPNNKKYFNWYINIIFKAQNQSRKKFRKDHKDYIYYENHHIFPKCLCNEYEKKDKNNIVKLTYKEHILCHKLLAYTFKHEPKLIRAYNAIFKARNKKQTKRELTIRELEFFKINSLAFANVGEKNGMFGKKHTDGTKEKIRIANTGRKHTEDVIEKLKIQNTGINNPFYGKKHTDGTKEKIRKNMPSQEGINNPFYGKKHTDGTKEKIRIAKKKSYNPKNHNKAKTYCFISPDNKEYLIKGEFGNFCARHKLSAYKMKSYVDKGKIPEQDKNSSDEIKNCKNWLVKSHS